MNFLTPVVTTLLHKEGKSEKSLHWSVVHFLTRATVAGGGSNEKGAIIILAFPAVKLEPYVPSIIGLQFFQVVDEMMIFMKVNKAT